MESRRESKLKSVMGFLVSRSIFEILYVIVGLLGLFLGLVADIKTLSAEFPEIWLVIILYFAIGGYIFFGRRILKLIQENKKIQTKHSEETKKLYKDLDSLKCKNRDFRGFITHIKDHHDAYASYENEDWKIQYDIDSKGNANYSRIVKLKIDDPINFYWLHWGITNGKPLQLISDLKIDAKAFLGNKKQEREIESVIYNITKSAVAIAFLLPYNRTTTPSTRVEFKGYWEGMYIDLINKNKDRNTIEVFTPTKKLQITLIAPPNKEFTDFQMNPKMPGGSHSIKEINNRSTIIFKATDVPRKKYSYYLFTKSK